MQVVTRKKSGTASNAYVGPGRVSFTLTGADGDKDSIAVFSNKPDAYAMAAALADGDAVTCIGHDDTKNQGRFIAEDLALLTRVPAPVLQTEQSLVAPCEACDSGVGLHGECLQAVLCANPEHLHSGNHDAPLCM